MTCSVDGCNREVEAKGFCDMHYKRNLRYGDPLTKFKPGNPPGDQLQNVMRHVEKNFNQIDCWAWLGATKEYGYGVITLSKPKRRTERVYRFLYEELIGKVPVGLDLDHYLYPQDGCIGPNCCNPTHLNPVTHRENSLRTDSPPAINAKKTHCIHGHEFVEENIYRRPSRPKNRDCLTCLRERNRKQNV